MARQQQQRQWRRRHAGATLALDAGISGAQAARVDIGTPGSASWHVQLSHDNVRSASAGAICSRSGRA